MRWRSEVASLVSAGLPIDNLLRSFIKMTIMDPKAAAEAIRDAWKKDPPAPPSPEGRHEMTFLEKVCEHLGVDPSPDHTAHVAHLMAKAGIEQHQADEYPKMLTKQVKRGPDTKGGTVALHWPDDHELAGLPVIVHSAEEEAEYNAKYGAAA